MSSPVSEACVVAQLANTDPWRFLPEEETEKRGLGLPRRCGVL